MTKVITRKRVNVTLPRDTLHLVDRFVEKGDRSRFFNEAVRFYVKEAGRANLRKLLREGAQVRAERDLELAQKWFRLEDKAWPSKRRR
jgi:CopG family transcriptional regulator/antitoxin EndoAI